ncbi:MAG: glycosyltransferase family 2 protein [Candidatus Ratteibacteria bacterium]
MNILPEVGVVIVNWNGWKRTISCLESLLQIEYPSYQIILVDNDSTDGSIKKIVEWMKDRKEKKDSITILNEEEIASTHSSDKFILIKNRYDYGFGGGANRGIQYALNRDHGFVYLLSNDYSFAPNALSELVQAALSEKKIGMAGSKVYAKNFQDQILWFAGSTHNQWTGNTAHRGIREKDIGQYNTPEQVTFLPGSSLLIRSDTIRDIGFMDERYFLYYEDVEWCIRAKRKGWKVYYIPASEVYHNIHDTINLPQRYYLIRNKFLLTRDYFPWTLPVVILFFLRYESLNRLYRKEWQIFFYHWNGFFDFLRGKFGEKGKKYSQKSK